LSVATKWALALDRFAVLVFPTTLSAVDALLGDGVAERLCNTAFADLATDEAVYAILEVVDLVDASDFGFVEVFCAWVSFG
jgi:hypothetical protein